MCVQSDFDRILREACYNNMGGPRNHSSL